MVAVYKSHPHYKEKTQKTRRDYDAALALVSDCILIDGRRIGMLALKSITPGGADRLYQKHSLMGITCRSFPLRMLLRTSDACSRSSDNLALSHRQS